MRENSDYKKQNDYYSIQHCAKVLDFFNKHFCLRLYDSIALLSEQWVKKQKNILDFHVVFPTKWLYVRKDMNILHNTSGRKSQCRLPDFTAAHLQVWQSKPPEELWQIAQDAQKKRKFYKESVPETTVAFLKSRELSHRIRTFTLILFTALHSIFLCIK